MAPFACVNHVLECRTMVLTFGNGALKTRVEAVAREEGQKRRLVLKLLATAIVVAECLEARNSTHRIAGSRFDMIDIIEM